MNAKQSIHRHARVGLVVLALLVGGVGGWAGTTDIAGAVVASGSVVVESNVKKVQHPAGGIVGQILVRDGDHVAANDLLMRLDDTITRANLAIVTKGLDELSSRKARLEAERDGLVTIRFPEALLSRSQNAEVEHVLMSERRLFELRSAARNGQREQLRQRIAQLEEEARGYAAQERAKVQEITFITIELKGARELWEKNLMPITKLTALEREAARLEGERAQLQATIAQTKGKVSEINLQIIQIDRDLSSEVGRELREIDAKIGEFVERKVAAEDQLKRIDIRSPQDGLVHQLAVHTVGGVVTAGEAILLIVPRTDKLTVEARVAPQDIDQVRLGQSAMLRFSAFNQRTTPEIKGTVNRVSADAVNDQRTGLTYYTVRIALPPEEVARLGNVTLLPGMPVEAFIQTAERKVLSYILKPLYDQMMRAFREK
jgi:HlyD family secretion protein